MRGREVTFGKRKMYREPREKRRMKETRDEGKGGR